jgi:hypothetical protein
MIGNAFELLGSDFFSLASMIARVDQIPFVPGQALQFFRAQSINTLTAQFEVRDNLIALVQTSPRGSVGTQVTDVKRDLKSVRVPHVQVNDRIMADEVQGRREFGTTDELKTLEAEVNRRLAIGTRNLDATLEHMAITALQGAVLDADASTILSAHTLFGTSPNAEVAFNFANITTAALFATWRSAVNAIVRGIQDNLKMGALTPEVYALCGPTFFDAFTNNPFITASFDRANGVHQLGNQVGGFGRESHVRMPPFYFQGVWWQEYRGGSSYIADDKAVLFPVPNVGVEDLYPLVYAPADYVETVNTMGLPRYANRTVKEKFVDLEVQTNPLLVCTRPKALYMARSGA